jgi:hypothetical protein
MPFQFLKLPAWSCLALNQAENNFCNCNMTSRVSFLHYFGSSVDLCTFPSQPACNWDPWNQTQLSSLNFSVEQKNFHILALLVKRSCFVHRLMHTPHFLIKQNNLIYILVIFISTIEIAVFRSKRHRLVVLKPSCLEIVRFEPVIHKHRLFGLYQPSEPAVCSYLILYSWLMLIWSIYSKIFVTF